MKLNNSKISEINLYNIMIYKYVFFILKCLYLFLFLYTGRI